MLCVCKIFIYIYFKWFMSNQFLQEVSSLLKQKCDMFSLSESTCISRMKMCVSLARSTRSHRAVCSEFYCRSRGPEFDHGPVGPV